MKGPVVWAAYGVCGLIIVGVISTIAGAFQGPPATSPAPTERRDTTANSPPEESAYMVCRYAVRRTLPEDARIQWGDRTAKSVQLEAGYQTYRVVALYQILHSGGPRTAVCRLRPLPNDQWKVLEAG